MGWRESVRKQMNKAKSRQAENAASAKIYYENKKSNEKEKQYHQSLYYPSSDEYSI